MKGLMMAVEHYVELKRDERLYALALLESRAVDIKELLDKIKKRQSNKLAPKAARQLTIEAESELIERVINSFKNSI